MENLRLSAFVTLVAAVLFADQATKAAAAQRGAVAPNPSYALGVLGGSAPILIAGALVVLVGFLALVALPMRALGVSPVITALITGGLVSNILDRARFGAVRDFIATPWVIVNVADIVVAVGIIAFFVTATWRAYSLWAQLVQERSRSS